MSDPTTPAREPRDVIAREIDPWLEWGGERQAATAIITALRDEGYEIVRAAPEPDAPEITGAMIEAAGDEVKRSRNTAPPASELPPPGPSNIVVRTPSPLKAPERVEEQ